MKIKASLNISIAILILVNAVPLYGVIFRDWDISLLVLVYLANAYVMTIFSYLKLKKMKDNLAGNKSESVDELNYFYNRKFLIIHFVLYALIIFVVIKFLGYPRHYIELLLMGFLFLISHTISYIINFLGNKEYLYADNSRRLIVPFFRVYLLIIAIFIGVFYAFENDIGSTYITTIFIFFVSIKVFFDIILHLAEHLPEETRTTINEL